jgi:hypothetical protein
MEKQQCRESRKFNVNKWRYNMGQHKHNPTAIKAKNGELPPKPKKMSKREVDRLIYAKCQEVVYGHLANEYAKMQTEEFVDTNK